MYLRRTQRRRKDGSIVGYVQLAHNRRVDGDTRAEVLLNLGREDELDMDGLRRLAASILRFTDGDGASAVLGEDSACGGPEDGGLEVDSSWALGGVWLLDALWRRLGVPDALARVLGPRRFSTDVERVLFAMVVNRALEPCSKLACSEWAVEDVAIDGLDGIGEDQCYRAMDLLVEADTEAKVQEAVFFACSDLLSLEVDLLFFDTTSTYFERDEPERDLFSEDGEVLARAFRVYGHTKDPRPDLPQVLIGLAVTREGIPVRVWVWPGNTNDMSVVQEVKDDLRGWRLGRVVTVVDRGFSSDENLRHLTRAGGHWIAGERMRDGSPDAQAALSRQGRYQTVKDNQRVKEVMVGDGDGSKRFVVCHNLGEAERDKLTREQTITRLQAELERIKTARQGERRQGRRRASPRRVRAARSPDARARQTSTGRLLIDRKKINAEERLDGKYLLSTSDPDLSAEDVALATRTCSKPNAGSVTSRVPSSCGPGSIASSVGSARTSCSAGSRC